jgi:AraC family transcriptional regulator
MSSPSASALSSASRVKIARYAAGVMTTHDHDASSLTLVLAGRYEERIQGRAAWHEPGALLFYPAGEPHSQRFAGNGALKLSLSPPPAMLDYLADRAPLAEAPVAVAPELMRLGRSMAREIRLADAYSKAALEGLAWEMIALFGRHAGRGGAEGSANVAKAREVIAEHLDRPLSITRLAALCDVHPASLTRAFRRELGVGPGEHQRALRLKRALALVTETNIPLSEVALACGFCDQSHFSRAFKALYGCTPTTYRRA